MAEAEGLDAHANAVRVRMSSEPGFRDLKDYDEKHTSAINNYT
jgi:hypothetical protein